MKAVILAAGKGTRMKELTNEVPKPMLQVEGKPILAHILGGLMTAGIRDFCIITGWRAEAIEACFGDGTRLGAAIRYARQVVQDGTGKAPELAKDFVGADNFLLTYGDIPEVHGLIAPRALMAQIGQRDTCFLYPDAARAAEHLTAIYQAAGCPEQLEIHDFDGVHEIDVEAALDFFRRRLQEV